MKNKFGGFYMITDRDKSIIKFVEEHGSITINQCAKIFFPGNKEAYDQSWKRLRIICWAGLLKRYRKDPKSEAVYYSDKKLKVHDLKLLDVYGELSIFDVSRFDNEYKLSTSAGTNYVVDAAVTIEQNDTQIPLMVEVDYTHYTSKEKIKDIIYYLEHKHNVAYSFIVIQLLREEIEIQSIGDKSKLFLVPWNLDKFSNIIISSLRSDIQTIKDWFTNSLDYTDCTY
jgi:hypothetical protein